MSTTAAATSAPSVRRDAELEDMPLLCDNKRLNILKLYQRLNNTYINLHLLIEGHYVYSQTLLISYIVRPIQSLFIHPKPFQL